jgi:hypothetical protein
MFLGLFYLLLFIWLPDYWLINNLFWDLLFRLDDLSLINDLSFILVGLSIIWDEWFLELILGLDYMLDSLWYYYLDSLLWWWW